MLRSFGETVRHPATASDAMGPSHETIDHTLRATTVPPLQTSAANAAPNDEPAARTWRVVSA